MNQQLWWFVARSGGIVAWWLSSLSVLWGLALSTRFVRRKGAPAWLLDSHRFLGGLTVVFTALHLVGLVADDYVDFGASDLLFPFASSWRPGAVAAGVVAMYLLVAVELTSLLMRRIRRRLWRLVHMTSFGLFGFGTLHALTAGTDATNTLVEWSVFVLVALVAFLLLFRQLSAPAASRRPRVATEPSLRP